jgi:hypothetical protein
MHGILKENMGQELSEPEPHRDMALACGSTIMDAAPVPATMISPTVRALASRNFVNFSI